MRARSGTVFRKSPELFLLKEKNISLFLNDYCSTCCRVRRNFKNTLSGRSSGRALIKKEFADNCRSAQFRKDFLSGYHQRCGSVLAEAANDYGTLDILLIVSIHL